MWLAAHWVQLIGVAIIVVIIRTLRSINEKLKQLIAYAGLNDWRLRNAVDDVQRGIGNIYITNNDIGEKLSSRIWDTKKEVAKIKELLEEGIYVYGQEEHVKRRRAKLDRRIRRLREEAEEGDLNSQALYSQLVQSYVEAHKWLNIVAIRAPYPEDAIKRRNDLAAIMTLEELAEAERKAKEWLENHPLPDT